MPQITDTLEQLPWLPLISKSPRPEDGISCKTYSRLFSAHAIASMPSNSIPFLSACFTVIVGSKLPSTSYFFAFKKRNQVETINYLGKKDRNKPQRGGVWCQVHLHLEDSTSAWWLTLESSTYKAPLISVPRHASLHRLNTISVLHSRGGPVKVNNSPVRIPSSGTPCLQHQSHFRKH